MDLSEFNDNNLVNNIVSCKMPAPCSSEPCMMGIDEAGRGPVLGPMVYGCSYCPLSREEDLKALGCADSKTLSEEKREALFDFLHSNVEYIGWEIEIISPVTISCDMNKREKRSLNLISHDAAIGLIQRALDKGVCLQQVYLDTVGPPEKYQAKLKSIFPQLEITVAKKADSTYPIVSAASICAKVARDRTVQQWVFSEETDAEQGSWGSGYPGDGTTKKFLMDVLDPVFGFPQLVRFSWSTAEKIVEEKCVPVTWEDVDDEENKKPPSVLSFFKRNSAPSVQKHNFFSDRRLCQVSSL